MEYKNLKRLGSTLLFQGRDDVTAGWRCPQLVRYFRSSANDSFKSILRCMFPSCPFCLDPFWPRPPPPPNPHAPPFRREELVFSAHLFMFVFFNLSHGLWVAVGAVDTGYGSYEHDGDLRAGPNRKESASFSLHLREASQDHATPEAMASSAPVHRTVPTGSLRQIR